MWRRPGVLVTVVGACAVMTASAASVPLFLSSVGTESVALQVAERCPRDTGVSLQLGASSSQVTPIVEDPFVSLSHRLEPSNRWLWLERTRLAGADLNEDDTPANLLMRDDALEHVQVIDGSDGPGIWISDRAAALTGLGVGDQATVGGVTQVPVTGVYRDLSGSTVDRFWCSNGDLLLPEGRELVPPPPLVLADRETFASLMRGLDVSVAPGAWEASLRGGLTLTETKELVHSLACGPGGEELRWCLDGRPLLPGSQRYNSGPTAARDEAEFVEFFYGSSLPFVTERSRAIQTSVAGGTWPMALFGTLAGVGLVAAAASLWFDGRRREISLLTVRGVSPAGLGLKAVLELAGALLIGVVAGVGLAYGLVVWLGPSSALEPSALRQAALVGVFALGAAAMIVSAVVARRVRSHGAPRHRIRLGVLPWELLLAWVTLVSFRRLGEWGIPVGRGAQVTRVDVWGLLFPVLFIITAVAMLSRVLALAVRPLRRVSRAWPTALYLAIRRVARYRVAVLGLVAASAVAAGVLGYAATMNRSLDATLQAKARTFVGSDTVVRLADEEPTVPAALADRTSLVRMYTHARIEGERRVSATVLVIDPATLDRAAYWDATFSDASFRDVLDRLAAPPEGGRIPAVVVGSQVTGPARVAIVGFGTPTFDVERLRDVEAFPGMRRPEPTVIVAASHLEGFDLTGGRTEAWIRGDRDETLATLGASGTGYTEERRLTEVADSASFLTVSWTFGFMQSLGISAGLLVLGGVAVYLDARRRDRLLGYAFMRRMGLPQGSHRRALAAELTASVLVGCWVGLGIALVAAWLAYGRIDPVPSFRPDPLLRPAVLLGGALAAASLVLTVIAAVLAQRRVDRDDPLEVLRAGV
jgi:putative ABC transport system permease protein